MNLFPARESFYLLEFLDISNSCIWPSLLFGHRSCHFLKFLKCELVVILLDMKSLDLPELMLCCWRYFISAILVTL